jgi:hypothetical protein
LLKKYHQKRNNGKENKQSITDCEVIHELVFLYDCYCDVQDSDSQQHALHPIFYHPLQWIIIGKKNNERETYQYYE